MRSNKFWKLLQWVMSVLLLLLSRLLVQQRLDERMHDLHHRVQVRKLLLLGTLEEEDRFIRQWMSRLPEEWRADLESLQKRWLRLGYSTLKIKCLTFWHLFDMSLADVKIKLDNLLIFSQKVK